MNSIEFSRFNCLSHTHTYTSTHEHDGTSSAASATPTHNHNLTRTHWHRPTKTTVKIIQPHMHLIMLGIQHSCSVQSNSNISTKQSFNVCCGPSEWRQYSSKVKKQNEWTCTNRVTRAIHFRFSLPTSFSNGSLHDDRPVSIRYSKRSQRIFVVPNCLQFKVAFQMFAHFAIISGWIFSSVVFTLNKFEFFFIIENNKKKINRIDDEIKKNCGKNCTIPVQLKQNQCVLH